MSPNELCKLTFSWKVPALIASADMALIDTDDSPVRVVLAFEGDRNLFSTKNAMLSELSHALTGEPLPYATLMYVWCNTCAVGTVIINPRTDRIRKLVVESGSPHLNQWTDYERDIHADFEAAFGEAPGSLLALGIMTDSDNTRSTARAWYGPIQLIARQSRCPQIRKGSFSLAITGGGAAVGCHPGHDGRAHGLFDRHLNGCHPTAWNKHGVATNHVAHGQVHRHLIVVGQSLG